MNPSVTPLRAEPDRRALPAAAPAVPANWYLLAQSADLKPGRVLACDIAGREIVVHRGLDGELSAYAAHCVHMGCHLKHATADRNGLRCAMHHRLIARDGVFLRPDGSRSADLRQPVYPCAETLGGVFVWLGTAAPPPLPRPDLTQGAGYLVRAAGTFACDIPWTALIGNGCDMEHLDAVHDRALIVPPVVDQPGPGMFRIAYETRVKGHGIADRIMKHLSGDHIRASLTAINGTTMLVQSAVGRPSFLLLSMCPTDSGGTFIRTIAGVQGNSKSPADRLRLWVTARLFTSFLAKDFRVLDGLRWQPPRHAHSPGDATSQALDAYFRGLTAA